MIRTLTNALSSVPAIIGLPLVSFALYWRGIGVETLVFALSVGALTYSQLLIRSGDRDTRAIQAKLDGLIEASAASNDLVGIERKGGERRDKAGCERPSHNNDDSLVAGH